MKILTEPPEYSPAKSIFGKDATFHIPPYQRGYDWEEEYIEDLIKDIKLLLKARREARSEKTQQETLRKHFFGGIVLIKSEDQVEIYGYTSNVTRYDIVDGQQRITTFSLIFKLIKEAFEDIERECERLIDENEGLDGVSTGDLKQIRDSAETSLHDLNHKYLCWTHRSQTHYQENKLELSRRDDPYFQRLIRNQERVSEYESNNRLEGAYKKLNQDLIPSFDEYDGNVGDYFNLLSDIYNAILDDCEFVILSTSDKDQANRLFSVLNDRGKGLSETSLIRSRSIEILDAFPNKQRRVEELWDEILVREKEAEDFLRDFYTSFMGEKPPRRNLHDPFEEDILKDQFDIEIDAMDQKVADEESADSLEQLVEQLKNEALIFFQLSDGDWPYEDMEAGDWYRKRLHRLANVLGHKKAFPVLLSGYKSLNETEFSNLVHILEIFMFRYVVICNSRPSGMDNDYFYYAQKIRHTPDDYDIQQLAYTLKDLIEESAGEEVVKSNFSDIFEYNSRSPNNKKRIKHLLSTVESYLRSYNNLTSDTEYDPSDASLSPTTSIIFDISGQEVEHIYPQNPEEEDQDGDLDEIVHNIGNLTLLDPDENNDLGNSPFEEKSEHFSNSRLQINQEIADSYDDWNADAVRNRAENLAQWTADIFHPLSIDTS